MKSPKCTTSQGHNDQLHLLAHGPETELHKDCIRSKCWRKEEVGTIVAGGRQITRICRSRAARLQNARGRARARRPPLESCTFPCVQNSIFKNLENQALLPTETLSRLYTIINNISILFSKSSVLPSPRWTHS